MKFIAKIVNNGQAYYMRKTTWSFFEDRADRFDTKEACIAKTVEIKKFMKAGMFKLIQIIEVAE